jgi:putative membrane protein
MGPLCSTIGGLWVWKDGGPYFGVPLQNYFGWFFVVYIIYQCVAIYLSKFDFIDPEKMPIFSSKIFWLEAVAVYGIQGLSQIVEFIGATDHQDIYGPMAMVTLFTMMFVTLISYLKIKESNQLN